MKEMSLYETIFKRKSIRKYDFTPLDDKQIAEVSSYIGSLKPMYDNIKVETKIVSQKEVKTLMPIKAPYYIVIFSEKKEGYLTNVGFMFQQMDLFLSSKGIGSCWKGMPKPTKEILASSELEFVIVLAFGKAAEPLYRENTSEFKRKTIEKISSINNCEELLEPVRIAPSGINSQPWFLTGNKEIIHAYCVKSNFIKAFIYEDMNKIDMGIALCHLWLAVKNMGKDMEFILDDAAKNNSTSGYYYNTSIRIK